MCVLVWWSVVKLIIVVEALSIVVVVIPVSYHTYQYRYRGLSQHFIFSAEKEHDYCMTCQNNENNH